ncbi:MAG: TatD family hydrolase [Patescibacteria group bacterium]
MLIDSHCHLTDEKLNNNFKKIISDAKNEGIGAFITIGTNISDSKNACTLANTNSEIFCAVGIYPHEELNTPIDLLEKELSKLINGENVVAIGECGVDITDWKGGRLVQEQLALFEMQIQLALKNNLPLVIHNRNADKEVLSLLKQYKSKSLRGVVHCFASTWEIAKQYIDLGFYISFSGIITYKSGRSLWETVIKTPLDRFIVETDAPYLSPEGYRNKINEPKYVKIIAEKVAEVKKEKFEIISDFSVKNTCAIFGLKDLTW